MEMELSPDEERAYEQIVSQKDMFQSKLWKILDVSSRKGSRLTSSLAEKGIIDREKTVYKGRVTYLLTPTEQTSTESISPSTPDEQTQNSTSTAIERTDRKRSPDEDLTMREQRALAFITEAGGLYQSELWKELDVSSRTGTRIATSLEEKGLIERRETVYNGHNTYLLELPPKDLDFSLLMAGNAISPFIDSEDVDPQSSAFSQWLLQLEQDGSSRH